LTAFVKKESTVQSIQDTQHHSDDIRILAFIAKGFHLVSRLRDDAALWYSHNGVRTGKRGRPRIKGGKLEKHHKY